MNVETTLILEGLFAVVIVIGAIRLMFLKDDHSKNVTLSSMVVLLAIILAVNVAQDIAQVAKSYVNEKMVVDAPVGDTITVKYDDSVVKVIKVE